MKHKYVTVPDTPILIRAKKAYLNASDVSIICTHSIIIREIMS